MSSALKAIALYNFQPSASVELALQKGDVIIVRNVDAGDGWSEGELHGQRGLFPQSFVQMLSSDDTAGTPVTPLTPQSNKKLFMETLLTPTPNTIAEVFDEERAAELFAADHNDIQISVGPKWSHKPPSLTITVSDGQKQFRSSGIRLHKFYEVKTKELKVTVQRKYKHFLWLYDQLAEKCPCISLPPLPIKHGLPTDNEDDFKESRRRGLEKFLNRLAKHPILGCTKVLQIFLIATDDKEWRIGTGKHTSFIKGVVSKKKLFAAPIFNCVHYPPYNVPLNQLPAFDKFSKFSETLESNVSNLIRCCEALKSCHGHMSKCVKALGKDLQLLSRGGTPSLGRQYRRPSQGISLLPHSSPNESENEEESEHDMTCNSNEWNWRDDDNFTKLMVELQILGDKMRHVSLEHAQHQDMLEIDVIESFEEYSGIIHTLPVLIKKHEEAMAAFNQCKEKGSKKEAETMRQDCETLNNILLAELDYFSTIMIEDFQTIFLTLLKDQAEYHKKISLEWEAMHDTFYNNRPIRKATVKRSTTIPARSRQTDDDTIKRSASTDEIAPPINRTHKPRAELNGLTQDDSSNKKVPQYENVQSIKTLHSPDDRTTIEKEPPPLPSNPKPKLSPSSTVSNDISLTSEKEACTYLPKMDTKLAEMTKLPVTKAGTSSSFSHVSQTSKKTLTTRTLPRQQTNNENNSSELFKKLQERRQKIESQLISQDNSTTDSTGVLRWTKECDNENTTNLTKFGIIEEGGTFIV